MKMADFPNQDVILFQSSLKLKFLQNLLQIVSEFLRPRNVPEMKKENIFWTQPCLTPLHVLYLLYFIRIAENLLGCFNSFFVF